MPTPLSDADKVLRNDTGKDIVQGLDDILYIIDPLVDCSEIGFDENTEPLGVKSSVEYSKYIMSIWNPTNITQKPLRQDKRITVLPYLDMSRYTTMLYMFDGCSALVDVSMLSKNLRGATLTSCSAMFRYCKVLGYVPLFDTNGVTDMGNMFDGCFLLKTVPLFNTSSVTNMGYMFNNCSNLTDDSLNNILLMCANSGITTASDKTLTNIGFDYDIYSSERISSLSNYSTFISAGWTIGY